ncbi:MAG: phosphate signaling complex protein PhoU [Actinomycetia bacterium]|nr:phosphate signaling complex protein PhoU [Actinomycetes bacterium]
MRDTYHDELEDIGTTLVQMTRMVRSAMAKATTALLDGDLAAAERVISGDPAVDELRTGLDDRTFRIIARQQPVAADLRLLISSLHLSADLERMGDLATHIAKVARMRYPQIAVPTELRDVITAMGEVAQSLVRKVEHVIEGRDVELAGDIAAEDDTMDALHRKLFTLLLAPDWAHGTEAAIDLTLIGRYYERYADHAVSVARRIVFLVTGDRADAT